MPAGDPPTISLEHGDGLEHALAGVRNPYTLRVEGGGARRAGFAAYATAGDLSPDPDSPNDVKTVLELFEEEFFPNVAQDGIGSAAGGAVEFRFFWTPPGDGTEQATLVVSVNSVNNNRNALGDWPAQDELVIDIVCEDADADGHRAAICGGDDCDDDAPTVFTGADELCDGLDNDCDDRVDEDSGLDACPLQVGVCAGSVEYCDEDGRVDCEVIYGDDFEPVEVSCDGLDNDCNGDPDGDLVAPEDVCPAGGVCDEAVEVCQGDDGWACQLPDTYEEPERTCDGLDNDCDGQEDVGLRAPGEVCPDFGVCSEAVEVCLGVDGWECEFPDTYEVDEVTCDGLDNDCDGFRDAGAVAPDDLCLSRGVCEGSQAGCRGLLGWACVYPATYQEVEARCDGLDNDCDGAADVGLAPTAQECPVAGVCAGSVRVCLGADGWDCGFPDTYEPDEVTCDGLDNDCDGAPDGGVVAPDGLCPAPLGECVRARGVCRGAEGWECSYPLAYEPVEVTCDGRDNDCDGAVDDGLVEPEGLCPVGGVCEGSAPVCAAEDGWRCDLPDTYEVVEETCDGLDNDCDGAVDVGLQQPRDVCPTEGVCVGARRVCEGVDGWRCEYPARYEAQETACDGFDNDCDGQEDEALPVPDDVCPDDGVCEDAVEVCGGVLDWRCELPDTYEREERTCDGLDNDCDGRPDADLPAPQGLCLTRGVCAGTGPTCAGEQGWGCVYPDTYEDDEYLCDGLDNDCNGFVDDDCVCDPGVDTRVCGSEVGVCTLGVQPCPDGYWAEECEGAVLPGDELCDGEDDDCDGQVDEDVVAPGDLCPALGVCVDARPQCARADGWRCVLPLAHEADEATCDGLDNDCDGEVDESLVPPDDVCPALGVCADARAVCGEQGWACAYPETWEADEALCDGLDNDCDGEVDEEVEAEPGACSAVGVCAGTEPLCLGEDGWDCPYPDTHADVEGAAHCDGLDNDCDGVVDPDCECLTGEDSRPCGTNVGQCRLGEQRCVDGRWSEDCVGGYDGGAEECDGLDNDCDEVVDEELVLPSCPRVLGVCEGSVKPCLGIEGIGECDALLYGDDYETTEATCDGLDNDCDGRVDEGCACQPGEDEECGLSFGDCPSGTRRCGDDYRWGECVVPECRPPGSQVDAGDPGRPDAGPPPDEDAGSVEPPAPEPTPGGGDDSGFCATVPVVSAYGSTPVFRARLRR